MIIQDVLQQLENSTTPVVKILQRGEHFKVLVLGFKKGMVLKEHQTNLTTKLVIVDGSIVYRRANDSVNLNKFDEIDIPINVPHSVEAQEDSICFLIQG
jgi:quercetin dioxygenase-like cupin family protein